MTGPLHRRRRPRPTSWWHRLSAVAHELWLGFTGSPATR
jgi:hypothetical protein